MVASQLIADRTMISRWLRRIFLLLLVAVSSAFLSPPSSCGQSVPIYAQDFIRATFETPQTLVTPAATAAFSNYITQPEGFGSESEGMGYHYGVSLADNIQGKFLRKVAFAVASRRRDKYCPLGGTAPLEYRIRNVVLHSLFTVPQISHTVNWSSLPASLASAALSDVYQPNQQRTLSATFQRFGTNAAGYMFGDFLAEMTFRSKPTLTMRLMIGPR